MGLLLGAATFLGSADAAPAASSHARASAHHASVDRRGSHAARSNPSQRSRGGRGDPEAAPDDPGLSRDAILAQSLSESIGRAARGRLKNGLALPMGQHVNVISEDDGKNYGTAELVAMLEHSAARVSELFPGVRLTVGDLSKAGGGHLGSHRSHRSGRDVDVGFYFTDEHGHPVQGQRFVHFDAQGVGVESRTNDVVHFDARRNWALLQAMIEFEGSRLQYVFVAPRLQPLLLAEAERQGAPQALIQRATDLMSHYASGHDNHFHVRIHCPPGDEECIDQEPGRRRGRGHGHRPSSGHRAPTRR